jgi:hypothetical protein
MADPKDPTDDGLPGYDGPDSSFMNESGGSFLLDEFVDMADSREADTGALVGRGTGRALVKTNGSAGSSRQRSTSRWVLEGATIEDTFKGGPVCLSILAKLGVQTFQHNFLFNVAIFFKRKYPENWEEAMRWCNFFVLKPSGNMEKLEAIIKDFGRRDYEYRCKDEPICGFCHSRVCRLEPYGVGSGNGDAAKMELGLTKINRIPIIWLMGEARIRITSEDLLDVRRLRVRCLENGKPFPDRIKQTEWDEVVRRNIDSAVVMEPSVLFKTCIDQLEMLEAFFGRHIPHMVRARGEEYLAGRVGEAVRVRLEEGRIYFKWEKMKWWCERVLHSSKKDIDGLRVYVEDNGKFHSRTEGKGWFRSTHSTPINLFEEGILEGWLRPGEIKEE